MCTKTTELQKAILLFLDVFDKYARDDEGNKNTLTKAKAKCLMEKELPGIMESAKGKDDSDKLLKDLDEDGDGEIDFTKFLNLVASVTIRAATVKK